MKYQDITFIDIEHKLIVLPIDGYSSLVEGFECNLEATHILTYCYIDH